MALAIWARAAATSSAFVDEANLLEVVAASADLGVATVLAMRGYGDQVQQHVDSALATVDPADYLAFAARARHAAGLAAFADGSYVTAYAQLETFRRLGAAPWARRTEAELRACGVTSGVQAAPTGPGALAELTPQRREIVILASRGLTNGEIADRLFLSPRTVASHLYRAYPKLGIAARHQLRDLVGEADDQPR